MIIGGIDVGFRSPPAIDVPSRWSLGGVSLAGSTQQRDMGVTEYDVPVVLILIEESVKNQLENYLVNEVKPFGTASLTADAGDDLGFGATGSASATTMTFLNMQSQWVTGTKWNTTINFKRFNT